MTRRNFRFISEPCSALYRNLLRMAIEQASTAYVVIRNGSDLNDHARECLRLLEPELLSEETADQWPGTKLYADRARVITYRLGPPLLKVVERFSDGLYDWIVPDLPEDLGFRRADRSVWLASIAHEGDAWLELDTSEFERLTAACPEITATLEEVRPEP